MNTNIDTYSVNIFFQDPFRLSLLSYNHICQWIALREDLQETIDFPIKYGVFL